MTINSIEIAKFVKISDIIRMNHTVKFIVSLAVMYIGFMLHFYFDEKILSKKNPNGPFPAKYKNSLLFFNFFFGCITAGIILLFQRVKILRNPLPYFKAAFPHFLAAYLTNIAKHYTDYATLNVVKSAKPIAVMLCSMLIFRTKVPRRRVFVVFALCFGLIIFGYTGSSNNANNATIGYTVIGGALLCEGIYGPIVDQLNHATNLPYMTMFYMQFFNIFFTFISSSSAVIESFGYLKDNTRYIPQIAAFVGTNLIAQIGLFTLVSISNGLVLSIATTSRKFFTILISSIIFGHYFTKLQWVGIVIVFTALAIDIFSKKGPKKAEVTEPAKVKPE